MSAAEPGGVLEAVELTKVYNAGRSSEVHALRGASLAVTAGEMVAIMGPSGSGKSTLMHVLGCLDRPTSGEVRLGGRSVSGMPDRERTRLRAREIGFVFQGYNLIPTLSALENVALAREYAGHRDRTGPARAALDLVGLGDRAGHRPAQLSGGEQQRVALARALVNQPSLVLADEPTGNLDSERTAEIMALLRRLNDEHGHTVVIVTHEPDVGAACDRIVQVRDGRVV